MVSPLDISSSDVNGNTNIFFKGFQKCMNLMWNRNFKPDFSKTLSSVTLSLLAQILKSVIYQHLIMQRTAVSKRRKSTSLWSCRSLATASELLGSQRESICRWTSHSSAPLDKHQSVKKRWAGRHTISAKNNTR